MIMNCEFTVPYFAVLHQHLRKTTA